jgi:hypothetical protein
MPFYQTDPSYQRKALNPGQIAYLFGKYNDRTPPTAMSVTSVATAANVATLGVIIRDGLIPVVGALITTKAIPNAAGVYNVSNIALTAVSINSTTGVGTVSFALTSANLSTAAASGSAIVPQPIVGDSIATGNKSEQRAVPSYQAGNRQHGLSWFTQPGGTVSPSAVSISLQIADVDLDSEYTTVDTSTSTTGETRSLGNITANFVRVIATTITGGTAPTLAAGIVLA